ncbi:hypothetical protein LTR50_006821 [Elasticomyces elasticus]|nr:hypothetical protein LTR50_006821 [Elasticomyces elasticus]
MIEQAWDLGYNKFGRDQTGGIRGTRKYIGTPEVEALCKLVGMPYISGRHAVSSDGRLAHEQLLDHIRDYFVSGTSSYYPTIAVAVTSKPPVYLQQPGHSLTVVGYEQRADGSR